MVGVNKKQLLEYYSKKNIEDYFSTNYYQSITELINQMIRVRIIKRFFKKSLKQNENSKVLDLGCGDAKDIFSLEKYFGNKIGKCVGVDLSKNSIKELQNKSKNNNKFKFIVGDVEKIKLNEKFDIILSLEVLEHLLNPEKHIEIIKKHLKKDGILILSTPNKKYLFKDIYKFVRKFKKIEKEQDEDFEHINVISYLELKHLLRKNGFKIIDKRRTSLVFGDYYLDRFFVILLFLDSLFPKKMMYAGNGMVIAAKLK